MDDVRGIRSLPDDMLLYLSKRYLGKKECLTLALSGVSENFTRLYALYRKELNTSKMYLMTSSYWNDFFAQHIFPDSILALDVGHCYWLPADFLCSYITQMTNLQELNLQGTQVALVHLPAIFDVCQNLVKLSVSLLEENLDHCEEDVMGKASLDSLSQGFARLTHVNIFTSALYEEHYAFESWLVILGVLKWCRNCEYLVIKQSDFEMGSFPTWERPIVASIQEKLLPHLSWMRSLKSLVILRPGVGDHPRDDVLLFLLNWLFKNDRSHSPWKSLERLWIDGNPLQVRVGNILNGSCVKSYVCQADWFNSAWLLHHGRFRHLEHLGGIFTLQQFNYLPDLKYAQGFVRTIPTLGLQQFCQSHPMLEHLDITLRYKSQQQQYNFDENWKLSSLKVLVYNDIQFPNHGLLSRLVRAASANLQELHIEVDFSSREASRFFSNIHQFLQLTFLTVKMSPQLEEWHDSRVTEKLPSIDLKGCPKLERLHLTNCHSPHNLLSQLKYRIELPVNNLRDLRLDWGNFTSFGPFEVSSLLMELAQASPRLQRLVLCSKKNVYQTPDTNHQLENFLFTFVSEMKHLAVLCLVGFEMDATVMEVVKRRLVTEIIPNRPSFWFWFDQELPNGYDKSVPRIHYEEMVKPRDWSCAPPPL